jgi:hypothetical protein
MNESNINKDGKSYLVGADLQATNAVAVTPGETVFPVPCTLYIGTAGDVTVTTADGNAGIVFKNLANGSILPVLVTAVTAASATDILRLS